MDNKPGIKTTEFWMSFVAMVLGFVTANNVFPEDQPIGKIIALAVSVLAALGYTVARSMVKKESLKSPPKQQ